MAVEINEVDPMTPNGRPKWIVSDKEKSLVDYTVAKSIDGFTFYAIVPSNGPVPKELDQRFTSPKAAIEILTKYLHQMKPTQAVKNEETHKRIAEKKAKAEEKN